MTGLRPGWGIRHPELVAALDRLTPAASQLHHWAHGTLPLQISSYVATPRLPDELITSVRCIVEVDGQVVVTESPDDVNIWPGGRREPGETMRDTAIREVYEETGWHVEPDSLQLLGFLHLERLAPAPADHPYPHPDFVQLIFRARGSRREREDWKDLDGYVLRSWLATRAELETLPIGAEQRPFLGS